jgi:DNA-binding CsgD family transcriptional regulator
MNEMEEISRLIGEIYDASLDPDLWDLVLERMAAFLKTATASIGSFDGIQYHVNFNKAWGYDPYYYQLFLDRYAKTNPTNFSAWLLEAGDVASIGDVVPYEEYAASAIFREWGEPQGYIDAIQATLEKSATALAFFHAIRHKHVGLVDEELRRKLKLLTPHLRRSVLIGKVVDLHKVEAANLADTLDGLAAGMFLLDATARMIHANKRGRAMIDDSAVVRGSNGSFLVVDPVANQTLRDIVRAAGSGDAAIGVRGITIPIAGTGIQRFVAHVLPLTSGARQRVGSSHSAVAAVFVKETTLDGGTPIEALMTSYKLTPAELRVLMAIVEVGGTPEVAKILGISDTTVKTHLQRIFVKTGVNRQADLVKIVAGFMSPLC